jgi:hypothetical protein
VTLEKDFSLFTFVGPEMLFQQMNRLHPLYICRPRDFISTDQEKDPPILPEFVDYAT